MTAQERILDVAIRSFAERGFAGTSTVNVARDAGVTQPLVHHHFGSKDGLWMAAVDRVFAELPGILREEGESSLPDAALRFVRFCALRPEVAAILMKESASPGPRLTYLLDTYVRDVLLTALGALKGAQADGLVDPTLRPELLLMFMVGASTHLFHASAVCQNVLGIDVSSERTREDLVSIMHAVVRGVMRAS